MALSRHPEHSVYFYIPGTAILNPSYDHPISKALAIASKFIANRTLPSMFTPGADIELIDFDDVRLEKSVCKNFKTFYEAVTKSNKDRFYVQTPGDLGQTAWKKVAFEMKKEIQKRLTAEEMPLNVFITAHSHGGQIARYLAEEFKDYPNIEFHCATIETPLSIYSPLLMSENVKTWVHFYCRDDFVMISGSFFMQSENFMGKDNLSSPIAALAFLGLFYQWYNNMYAQRIEDVYKVSQEKWFPTTSSFPAGWRSFELGDKKFKLKDKHNSPVMDEECAKYISQTFLEFCARHMQAAKTQSKPRLQL